MHRALGFVGLVLAICVVRGIFVNRLARQCLSFSTLICASALFTALILLFPEHYTPEAYMVKQGIYDSLLFGMSLELSFRTFRAFRGVANKVRVLLAAAVIISTAVIFVMTPATVGYTDMVRYQAGITTGGIWCLTFVALLIVWYQIPVPAFTRAVLLGYVPYLVAFVICTDLIGRLGWGAIKGLNIANAVAYDAMAGYWAYAAWRKDS